MYVEVFGKKVDLGDNPSPTCKKRWAGELSPEPETVQWIEAMKENELFFDIGANIGRFSVMAAVRGVNVVAFEPVLEHFLEMSDIAARNKLFIMTLPLAISDAAVVGLMGKGRSKHAFHGGTWGAGHQAVLSMTVDQICGVLRMIPQHVKIDVDGNEVAIINGMMDTLRNTNLKSVLIEIDPQVEGHDKIPMAMKRLGFFYDQAQVDANMIKEGKYKGMANYIFKRTSIIIPGVTLPQ